MSRLVGEGFLTDISAYHIQWKQQEIRTDTQRSRSLPITSTVNVAGTLVQISNQVRILGVTLDSRRSFDAHISALSKSCLYHIRALRHIRPNLTLDCSKNIACSLVGCRLDYANSTLVGISINNIY